MGETEDGRAGRAGRAAQDPESGWGCEAKRAGEWAEEGSATTDCPGPPAPTCMLPITDRHGPGRPRLCAGPGAIPAICSHQMGGGVRGGTGTRCEKTGTGRGGGNGLDAGGSRAGPGDRGTLTSPLLEAAGFVRTRPGLRVPDLQVAAPRLCHSAAARGVARVAPPPGPPFFHSRGGARRFGVCTCA